MCWCWRSLPRCPRGFPCAVGLELGFSSAPNVQLWLPGHRGHGWMADGGYSVPRLLCNAAGRCTWSCLDFGEACTCQGSCHLRPGQEGPARVPPCPSPEHSHHRESPGMSQCSSRAGQSLLQRGELREGSCGALAEAGPGCLRAGPAARIHRHCPHPWAPSVSLHVCDALSPQRLGFEVEIKH